MTKVTGDWDKWVQEVEHLAYKFQLAVDYNRRDDEISAAQNLMEFLQETFAALKSNPSGDYDGPDKEDWDD